MTEDELVEQIRNDWGVYPRQPRPKVLVPVATLCDLIATSQHGRSMMVATALALRSGITNVDGFSNSLLAEADDLGRRLSRTVDGLWQP